MAAQIKMLFSQSVDDLRGMISNLSIIQKADTPAGKKVIDMKYEPDGGNDPRGLYVVELYDSNGDLKERAQGKTLTGENLLYLEAVAASVPVAAEWKVNIGPSGSEIQDYGNMWESGVPIDWYGTDVSFEEHITSGGNDGETALDLGILKTLTGEISSGYNPHLADVGAATVTVTALDEGGDLILKFVHNTPGAAGNSDAAFQLAVASLISNFSNGPGDPIALTQTVSGADGSAGVDEDLDENDGKQRLDRKQVRWRVTPGTFGPGSKIELKFAGDLGAMRIKSKSYNDVALMGEVLDYEATTNGYGQIKITIPFKVENV